MKCAKESCGAEITDGAKFCSICGTKVVVTTIVKKALCPVCNQFVLESHNFCLNCGWKVDPAIFTDKICRGVKENGEQCSVVLTFDTKFCPTCGTPTNSSDVSSEPVRTEQGTSKEYGKDNNLNPTVSVQKPATASLSDECETKEGKEEETLIEQEKKGLHVEKNKNSDESDPGSPEIWTPPTIVLKESSDSSNHAEISTEKGEIGEKTNGSQDKVTAEIVLPTTDKAKLSDLSQQKEDSQETENKEGETISGNEASLAVDTKDTRSNVDGDKDFQGDGSIQSNRTTGQQISQPTENYDHNEKETKEDKEQPESITIGNTDDRASGVQSEPENPANEESENGKQLENTETSQSDDGIDGQPKSDDTINDEKKSEKSTEIKANDENNRNQDKTSAVEIADVNQSALQMATGDLDTGKKEEKTDELLGNQRKEFIKIEDAAKGHSSTCEETEESSSSDFVAEKHFTSEPKVESVAAKSDDRPDPKCQSRTKNLDGIDKDNTEPKPSDIGNNHDNLTVLHVTAEDLGDYRYNVDQIQRGYY